MSARACIAGLRAEGKIDAERADRFMKELDRLEASYGKSMGGAAAAQAASADLVDRIAREAAERRRQTLLQLGTQRDILTGLTKHLEAGRSAKGYALALFDHHEAAPGISNISNRHIAVKQLAWSKMGDFLDHFKRDLLGRVPHIEDMRDMAAELFGTRTGNDVAAELARAFDGTAEWLRQQFNAAGGHIGKMKDWGLPQAHDALAVAKAGYAAWRDFIKPKLAVEKMVDGASGKPFTEEGFEEALQATWKTIASDGLDKLEPGQMVGSKLANQRADSRFLIFKDADSWLEYQARFGVGDPMNAIINHIDSMSKDIAAMQVLGPNPGLTVRWLGDLLRKDAAPTLDGGKNFPLGRSAVKGAREIDRMWRYYRGELTSPDPVNRGRARFFSGLRNWSAASNLGQAFLSAVGTDPVFAAFTAKFNGLSATRVLGEYAAQMNPASSVGRRTALHAGLVFNEMTTTAERMWREDGAMRLNVHELTRRTADGVMRASLLAPHTVAMKKGIGVGFMMDFAENAGRKFGELEKADQLKLSRYGIDAKTWDFIRETPLYEQEGYKLLRPGDVASRDNVFNGEADKAAMKLFEMIDSETKFAVPGESLRAQTALALGGRGTFFERGTYAGELAHSATQFKTYSVIAMMTHMQRAIYGNGGLSRGTYALMLPLFLTLGGGAVITMKAIATGKDPEPMTSAGFWGRAFVQGGGAGMAGDFISAGLLGRSRTGGTLAGYLAGPTVSNLVDPALDLLLGNLGKVGQGKKTDFQHEAVQMAERNIPGTGVWYLNLATHRWLLDQLNQVIDPNYRKSWDLMGKRAKQQHTQYYWPSGETRPQRAPNMQNAVAPQTAQ